MRLGSIKYLVKTGLKNMGANRLMSFASIGVLTACFIITGFATLLLLNVNAIVDFLAGQNEIVVNLKTEITDEEALAIGEQLKAVANVSGVEFVSKGDAFQSVQSMLGEYANTLEGLQYENIFPARFNVTVDDLNYIEQTNARIVAIPGVDTTYVPVDLAGVMIFIKNGVTYGGYGIVIMLAAVSVIVIVNTIRLTVFARRREISIMKYVGATNAFIRLPFFIEGMFVGIFAGLISTGLIAGGYYMIYDFLQGMHNVWVLGILSSIIKLEDIWPYILAGSLVLGMALGGLGTALSVRKHLKV